MMGSIWIKKFLSVLLYSLYDLIKNKMWVVLKMLVAAGRRRRAARGAPSTHKSSLSGSFQPITRDAEPNLIAARHQLPCDHRSFLFTGPLSHNLLATFRLFIKRSDLLRVFRAALLALFPCDCSLFEACCFAFESLKLIRHASTRQLGGTGTQSI